jgi:hypothetical protein
MSILSSIMNMVTPVIVDRIAASLGINSTIARTAINLALPAILGAFASKASTPAGANQLFQSVSNADPGLFNSLDRTLSGSDKDQFVNAGMSSLNGLLGNGVVNSLLNTVGSKAGLSGSAASMLLPVVGQMAMSGLAKSAAGKDASGLASMLAQEAGSFTSQSAAAPQSSSYEAPAAPDSTGMLKWLIPVLALGALGWWFMGNQTAQQPVPATTTSEQAPASGALVVEGVDVTQQLTTAMSGITTSLGTVTNAATAEAALPKLLDAAKAVDAVSGVSAKFSAEQKTAVGTLLGGLLPAAKTAAEQALAKEGVGTILKPVVDGIFAKLDAMTK